MVNDNSQNVKVIISIIVLSLLVACAPAIVETEPPKNISTEPILTTMPSISEISTATLSWSSNADEIILQYDLPGGLMGSGPGTNLPVWTLYGDGLLVWTEDGLATPGFTRQIWVGHLSDAEIRALMTFVDEQGFWDLASSYQPEQFIVSTIPAEDNPEGFRAVMPNPEAGLDQPSGVIMVAMNNLRHQVTIFPAGWPDAPEAYKALRQYILEIRPDDATTFVPMTFSLRARELSNIGLDDPQVALWPYADIRLTEVANKPLLLEREQGISVADFIAVNGQKVAQNETVYNITLMATPPRH